MINKIRQILLIILTIIIIIGFFIKNEIKSTKNQIIIEQQNKIIEQQNDVIETKAFQQKLIKKPVSSNSIASRDQWLQLIWAKSERAS